MKKHGKMLMLALLTCIGSSSLLAQEVREITFNEDRDQTYMCSKVFKLKYTRAVDLTPFVLGAVKRYNSNSKVDRLNYGLKKEQYLVVNTAVDFMPYVEDMIAKLDRPGKLDQYGSVIESTGISRCSYSPKFRSNDSMIQAMDLIKSGDGDWWRDPITNIFYWKDSPSDCKYQGKWIRALDRPVPQASLTLNVYEFNKDNFTELGLDYVNWKNGPGMNLIAAGWDWTTGKAVSSVGDLTTISDAVSKFSSNVAGFMVAPEFDATFLRMLNQKGYGNVATSTSLTLVNDFMERPPAGFADANYKIKFSPNYQNLSKNGDHETSIDAVNDEVWFYAYHPLITFFEPPVMKGGTPGKTATAQFLKFSWVLSVKEVIGHITTSEREAGVSSAITNEHTFSSTTNLVCGSEKIMTSYEKETNVKQYNGMPFLKDIPGMRYLVGSAVKTKNQFRIFVTAKATSVVPGQTLSSDVGGIIDVAGTLYDPEVADKPEAKKETKAVKTGATK